MSCEICNLGHQEPSVWDYLLNMYHIIYHFSARNGMYITFVHTPDLHPHQTPVIGCGLMLSPLLSPSSHSYQNCHQTNKSSMSMQLFSFTFLYMHLAFPILTPKCNIYTNVYMKSCAVGQTTSNFTK